jgi:hypothetical protein
MKLLSIPEFLNRKQHDSIAIFGSGYSINLITPRQWETIENNYDTWGMNWFCKSRRPTTWYMVREQCASPKRIEEDHTLIDFYDAMRYYAVTTKIVKDMSYRPNNYQHVRNLDNLEGDGYVFNEIQGGCSVKNFRDDIFDVGIHHGKNSMYDALHFAVAMNYKKIVVCGVDLYDNRYFYLPFDTTLQQTKAEGQGVTDPHKTTKVTVQLFGDFLEYWKLPTFIHNPQSVLKKVVPVWDGT